MPTSLPALMQRAMTHIAIVGIKVVTGTEVWRLGELTEQTNLPF